MISAKKACFLLKKVVHLVFTSSWSSDRTAEMLTTLPYLIFFYWTQVKRSFPPPPLFFSLSLFNLVQFSSSYFLTIKGSDRAPRKFMAAGIKHYKQEHKWKCLSPRVLFQLSWAVSRVLGYAAFHGRLLSLNLIWRSRYHVYQSQAILDKISPKLPSLV